MQKNLLIKLSVIAALCVLFLIGLMMLGGLVSERKHYERAVIDEISQTQLGTPILTTPFLVIDDNGKKTPIIADESHMAGKLDVTNQAYVRGIYHATSFQSIIHIEQSYSSTPFSEHHALVAKANAKPSVAAPAPTANRPNTTQKAPATLSLYIPISDLRGAVLPKVHVNGKAYSAKFAKSQLPTIDGYSTTMMEVALGEVPTDKLSVAFDLDISGLSGLHIAPLGSTQIKLLGNWAEPKFFGDTLPNAKKLDTTGFEADWHNAFLGEQNSLNLKDNFRVCQDCQKTSLGLISLEFVEMDNVYIKTERTLKYALILLVVSFGAFFLFEVIKGLKIHPVQYLLVLAALLVFYGLLLSLAELIIFWQAYAIAASACVLLIGWYATFVLKSLKRSLVFSGILASLYAGFYVVLSVSEMNLLLGALFCFMLVFVAMYLTRHIDWYQIGTKE